MNKHDIVLKTRKKLFLESHGEHLSVFDGEGLEFSEVREYNINDDVRHINWKITARKQKPTVNIYHESKQLGVTLVYLVSGSLYFGVLRSKAKMATEILTALSYAVIAKNDLLTTLFFDSKELFFYKPTRNKNIVDINFDKAIETNVLGRKVDFTALTEYLMERVRRKSIILLVGDFLEMPDFSILASKYELYCAVVRDRAEEDLTLLGEFDLVDAESLKKGNFKIDRRSAKHYKEQMSLHDAALNAHFMELDIRYEKIYTDDDLYAKLARLTRV